MSDWRPYPHVYTAGHHTVRGDIRVWSGATSHGLAQRDILVYLPPGYVHNAARRYPTLYLHDGQNVFDSATSYAGEWGADETAEALAARGLEAILVAIPNAGKARSAEYSPWPLSTRPAGESHAFQPSADAYLDFLLHTVKARVDASFRTDLAPARTGIVGSSLGALISLYACLARPGVFGYCGALSPALWPGHNQIFRYAQSRRAPGLRVYLDAGWHEAGERFVAQVRRMDALLRAGGHDVAYVEDPDGRHDEESWRRRFPAVLEWFLDPCARPLQSRHPHAAAAM